MEYKTKQKEKILSYLNSKKDYVVSANDIIKDLGKEVSKATIYRYLDQLEKEEKVKKQFNKDTSSYEYLICANDNSCLKHLHLKCIKCGKMIHLHCSVADSLLSHISKEHNFFITPNNNTLTGLCSSCSLIKGEKIC